MVRWLSKMRRRHIYKHIDPTQVNDSLKGKYTSPMDLSYSISSFCTGFLRSTNLSPISIICWSLYPTFQSDSLTLKQCNRKEKPMRHRNYTFTVRWVDLKKKHHLPWKCWSYEHSEHTHLWKTQNYIITLSTMVWLTVSGQYVDSEHIYIYTFQSSGFFAPKKKQGKHDDSSFGKPPDRWSQNIEIWDTLLPRNRYTLFETNSSTSNIGLPSGWGVELLVVGSVLLHSLLETPREVLTNEGVNIEGIHETLSHFASHFPSFISIIYNGSNQTLLKYT